MKRRLFNPLAALSLLLCVATVVLLVRSHWICEIWSWSDCSEARSLLPGKCYAIASDHDELALMYLNVELNTQEQIENGIKVQSKRWHFDHTRESSADLSLSPSEIAPQGGWRHLGFGYLSNVEAGGSSAFAIRIILLPHWFVASVFAAMPLFWTLSWHNRRRRTKAGHCRRCGYDLRATPDRCPECGGEV